MDLPPKIIQSLLSGTDLHGPRNGPVIARPSSTEEGIKNVEFSTFAGMTTKKLPPASGDNPHEKS